ncbi:T6SS phospholipase effector Tle1-like catalytic domain-containing protein, partial [Frateuria defendens]|uniref:phospholipase effector Tle1 domain-containing protein n=1 Tax=Frateuria defendens TaxID=2219559 RepID=UPI000B2D1799
MGEQHKLGKDGVLEDGVLYYPADAARLQTYRDASQALSRFQTPVLVHTSNPHGRLYVAAFDGTGNDVRKDPEHATNIAKIYAQIADSGNPQIKGDYVEGPGTQDNAIARTWDGMTGGTYDQRIEEMYKRFINQAKRWRAEDPQAEIRVADIGFSRGAEQAAGFARLVHERGIQDPSGAYYTHDSNSHITSVTYTKPPLVAPGQVAQAEALFDPVGTGHPYAHDRRPPPSVISGFQVMAEDERRAKFKSDHIIDPGLSPDGRFLGVAVAGAHSDVGGSYHRDGLAIRSDNLMIDYLNALSDKPFLARSPEPDDPRLNVVHRSEEGMLLYRLDRKVDRQQPEGYNERLAPRASHLFGLVHRERPGVADPYNAEPRDEALSQQFERQTVQTGPTSPQQIADAPARAAAPGRSLDEA